MRIYIFKYKRKVLLKSVVEKKELMHQKVSKKKLQCRKNFAAKNIAFQVKNFVECTLHFVTLSIKNFFSQRTKNAASFLNHCEAWLKIKCLEAWRKTLLTKMKIGKANYLQFCFSFALPAALHRPP